MSASRNPVDASRSASSLWSRWIPVAAYAVGIFFVSSISQARTLPGDMGDKTAHSLAYAGFALVLLRALAGARWRGVTAVTAIVAASLATLYGASDELHQYFVPGRDADVLDVAADARGALVAAAIAYLIARMRRRRG
jgi:VanZ family protein